MDKDVVNSTDEIPAVGFVVPRWLLRAQTVEETDLAQDYWLGGLEKGLPNPAENDAGFKETVGTGRNYWASPGYGAVTRLLI